MLDEPQTERQEEDKMSGTGTEPEEEINAGEWWSSFAVEGGESEEDGTAPGLEEFHRQQEAKLAIAARYGGPWYAELKRKHLGDHEDERAEAVAHLCGNTPTPAEPLLEKLRNNDQERKASVSSDGQKSGSEGRDAQCTPSTVANDDDDDFYVGGGMSDDDITRNKFEEQEPDDWGGRPFRLDEQGTLRGGQADERDPLAWSYADDLWSSNFLGPRPGSTPVAKALEYLREFGDAERYLRKLTPKRDVVVDDGLAPFLKNAHTRNFAKIVMANHYHSPRIEMLKSIERKHREEFLGENACRAWWVLLPGGTGTCDLATLQGLGVEKANLGEGKQAKAYPSTAFDLVLADYTPENANARKATPVASSVAILYLDLGAGNSALTGWASASARATPAAEVDIMIRNHDDLVDFLRSAVARRLQCKLVFRHADSLGSSAASSLPVPRVATSETYVSDNDLLGGYGVRLMVKNTEYKADASALAAESTKLQYYPRLGLDFADYLVHHAGAKTTSTSSAKLHKDHNKHDVINVLRDVSQNFPERTAELFSRIKSTLNRQIAFSKEHKVGAAVEEVGASESEDEQLEELDDETDSAAESAVRHLRRQLGIRANFALMTLNGRLFELNQSGLGVYPLIQTLLPVFQALERLERVLIDDGKEIISKEIISMKLLLPHDAHRQSGNAHTSKFDFWWLLEQSNGNAIPAVYKVQTDPKVLDGRVTKNGEKQAPWSDEWEALEPENPMMGGGMYGMMMHPGMFGGPPPAPEIALPLVHLVYVLDAVFLKQLKVGIEVLRMQPSPTNVYFLLVSEGVGGSEVSGGLGSDTAREEEAFSEYAWPKLLSVTESESASEAAQKREYSCLLEKTRKAVAAGFYRILRGRADPNEEGGKDNSESEQEAQMKMLRQLLGGGADLGGGAEETKEEPTRVVLPRTTSFSCKRDGEKVLESLEKIFVKRLVQEAAEIMTTHAAGDKAEQRTSKNKLSDEEKKNRALLFREEVLQMAGKRQLPQNIANLPVPTLLYNGVVYGTDAEVFEAKAVLQQRAAAYHADLSQKLQRALEADGAEAEILNAGEKEQRAANIEKWMRETNRGGLQKRLLAHHPQLTQDLVTGDSDGDEQGGGKSGKGKEAPQEGATSASDRDREKKSTWKQLDIPNEFSFLRYSNPRARPRPSPSPASNVSAQEQPEASTSAYYHIFFLSDESQLHLLKLDSDRTQLPLLKRSRVGFVFVGDDLWNKHGEDFFASRFEEIEELEGREAGAGATTGGDHKKNRKKRKKKFLEKMRDVNDALAAQMQQLKVDWKKIVTNDARANGGSNSKQPGILTLEEQVQSAKESAKVTRWWCNGRVVDLLNYATQAGNIMNQKLSAAHLRTLEVLLPEPVGALHELNAGQPGVLLSDPRVAQVNAIRNEFFAAATEGGRFANLDSLTEHVPDALKIVLPPPTPSIPPLFRVSACLDPLSEEMQIFSEVVGGLLAAMFPTEITLVLNPTEKYDKPPLTNYYRQVILRQDHDESAETETKSRGASSSSHLEIGRPNVLSLQLEVPDTWLVSSTEAEADFDNLIVTGATNTTITGVFELSRMYMEGQAWVQPELPDEMKAFSGFFMPRKIPAAGVELGIFESGGAPAPAAEVEASGGVSEERRSKPRSSDSERDSRSADGVLKSDARVLRNLAYFQLAANPGMYSIKLLSAHGTTEKYELTSAPFLTVDSFITPPYTINVREKDEWRAKQQVVEEQLRLAGTEGGKEGNHGGAEDDDVGNYERGDSSDSSPSAADSGRADDEEKKGDAGVGGTILSALQSGWEAISGTGRAAVAGASDSSAVGGSDQSAPSAAGPLEVPQPVTQEKAPTHQRNPPPPSKRPLHWEKNEKKEATVHIFSVASGHLYEKLLSIMILSVRNHTTAPLHFWLMDQFLSPRFKHSFIPAFAKKHDFAYTFISYKWPSWLNPQSEKQRLIWAYKILFLDVFFPLDVERIVFVDADQIVRADVRELRDLDMGSHVYGFTPMGFFTPLMGDSNQLTEGFRFWKQGYWKKHLEGKPYHISALFVVNLKLFREKASGDELRQIYNQLSRDPNSLANLDQDLPNFAQHSLPIFSLPKEWLWCETWCSSEELPSAKTIDLCQNPLTKEPKLTMARRIAPEWSVYHDEVVALQQELKGNRGGEPENTTSTATNSLDRKREEL
eukprot:g608.t1